MIVAFSVTPIGVGTDVAEYVADAVEGRARERVAEPDRCDVHHHRGRLGRSDGCGQERVRRRRCPGARVSVTLKADIRPGVTGALESKMASLRASPGLTSPAVA